MNLQNLIDFGKWNDIDVLEGVAVPAPLSVETMKNAIMIRCGLLTPVYGEPDLFRDMVKHWFTTEQWNIEHLIKIIQAEYSPIENYDRYEDLEDVTKGKETEKTSGKYTDTHSGSDKERAEGKYNDTHSGSDKEVSKGDVKNNDSSENTVSAYNSDSYQPDTKTTDNKQETHTDDKTITHGHKIANTHEDEKTFTHGHKLANTHEDEKIFTRDGGLKRTAHMHGNIGVTTNQQMIEQELELLRHFNIYGWIAERFEEDNMLMIY